MTVRDFGITTTGENTQVITLSDDDGLTVQVTDYGATLVGLWAPDRDGTRADVLLGFDSVAGYEGPANAYFGATVGRVANRIAGAWFAVDGHSYRLAANEGPNHLHGGSRQSLDRVVWRLVERDRSSVRFQHVSPAGTEGYPGTLSVWATYTVRDTTLTIHYAATTDAAGPVNLTNHMYLNLAGAGADTVLDHQLELAASAYTPVGADLIPTGDVEPISGGPLDFRSPRRLGERIADLAAPTGPDGYDHNLVLDGDNTSPRTVGILTHPPSGRSMRLATDQPCLQVYSANHLPAGTAGKNGQIYGPHAALCLEPQQFPNAVHCPDFPSVILRPGQTYTHTSSYTFGVT
ncbi:aldose epimerase family protein [Lipingzhangella sp. LS1_29]|uniref:Aldose 1-epimerase n=1 Tax=Lipingzhangella rawalii TaxID=2055835 RepID=A0ABU2H0M8_9ACTN|nr:aldose epimerase family protein [Lipingzhangella rawalii]MDS1268852.1 aldose epimerase family protein [Lipingzhangella rawalii]